MGMILLASLFLLLAAGLQPLVAQTPAPPPILPADVHAETRSRLPTLSRAEMKEGSQKFFDKYSPEPRPFYQRGPHHAYVYSPAVAQTLGHFMSTVRKEGVISPAQTEVAILVAAREIDQKFVWSAHERMAISASVPKRTIDAIKFDRDVASLPDPEAVLIRFGRQLFRDRKVSPELFARAVTIFGRQGVVELTAIMGYYVSVGMMLNAVDQQLPPNALLLPDRR